MRMTRVMTSVAACALLGFAGCDSGHDADVQTHARSFVSAQAFAPEQGTAQTFMPAPRPHGRRKARRRTWRRKAWRSCRRTWGCSRTR